ncbi:MAG: ACT domain-containing protein, partial [Candidatus Micrarchaeota archaeon]
MKSVTIVSDDRVGLLADISYILGKSNLNIDGLFVDVIGGKAVISLEVKDIKKTTTVLEQNGYTTADAGAIVIKISNNEVSKISEMLAGERVIVKDISKISSDICDGVFAVQVDKPRKALKLLAPFILGNISG